MTEKVRKIDRQPKPVAVKKESDEMSIHEMKSGKRKSMDSNENPPKKQKIDQNIVTKKIEQRDFKIFGSDKLSKSAKKLVQIFLILTHQRFERNWNFRFPMKI